MNCFRFMKQHRDLYHVTDMARVLGVSTSGFYDWLKRTPSARQRRRRDLAAQVREVHAELNSIYGSRKITDELKDRDVQVCRNTVARLMRRMRLRSRSQKRRFVVTTDSGHDLPIAPNTLGRDFTTTGPNQKWVADITYIRTGRSWTYLAVVMDLFARKIVGWAVSDSLETSLVAEAFREAVERRRPGPGLLHHSDRGSQYASAIYRDLLDEHGIECSMSRRGDCWDNAVMERFMNSLKNEWTNHHEYRTIEEVRASVFEYIEIFYHRRRRHQALGSLTPQQFEDRMNAA